MSVTVRGAEDKRLREKEGTEEEEGENNDLKRHKMAVSTTLLLEAERKHINSAEYTKPPVPPTSPIIPPPVPVRSSHQ